MEGASVSSTGPDHLIPSVANAGLLSSRDGFRKQGVRTVSSKSMQRIPHCMVVVVDKLSGNLLGWACAKRNSTAAPKRGGEWNAGAMARDGNGTAYRHAVQKTSGRACASYWTRLLNFQLYTRHTLNHS